MSQVPRADSRPSGLWSSPAVPASQLGWCIAFDGPTYP